LSGPRREPRPQFPLGVDEPRHSWTRFLAPRSSNPTAISSVRARTSTRCAVVIFFNSQVLFVHNPKTAGTSLLQFFRDAFDEPFHMAGTPELGTYHPSLARACSYACAVMSVKPEQFSKIITCVRNPYAREVSMYWYFRDVLSTS